MHFKSKKTPLLILGVTSVVCSRIMFLFFNDPEGLNLLVVIGIAGIVYSLSSVVIYLLNPSIVGPRKLLLAIFIQIMVTAGFYFGLN